MRVRHILSIVLTVFGIFAISACKDSTAPTSLEPVDQAWQMVIQSNLSGLTAVSATKNTFFDLSMDDFHVIETAAYNLRSSTDTVYVGLAIDYGYVYGPKARQSINWRFSGNLSASASGMVNFGRPASFYQVFHVVDSSRTWIEEPQSSQTLTLAGDDFLFEKRTESSNTRQTNIVLIVYVPVTCSGFAARQLQSNGIDVGIVDSTHSFRWRLAAPSLTVTCNPKAPTALRAARADTATRVRLVDFLRSQRQQARR